MQYKISMKTIVAALALTIGIVAPVSADKIVTVHNYARAETDRTFQAYVDKGGFGKFVHFREPTPIDKQDVIRMNRDTLYSLGVFDLSSPVTVVKPEHVGRLLLFACRMKCVEPLT
jgi:hypothetical protein